MSTATKDFDPNMVPVFPVLNIEVTPSGGALLNGRTLVVDDGQNPTDVAVAAAAAEAALLPGILDAVRVRAVDGAGVAHNMVIRADGTAFDITPPPSAGARPAWWLPAAALAIAVVLGAGVLVTVSIVRSQATPAAPIASTPAPLPGAGSNLPIEAPPGYAQKATWAVPIDERVVPVPTPAGDLLVKTVDGDLALLDAKTGATKWSGKSGGDKLHTFASDGALIAATNTGQEISLWTLPTNGAKDVHLDNAAVKVDLPAQSTVSYDGGAPLVTLPDQTAAFITQGVLTRVDVPIGATALTADQDSVIAVGTDGTWYALTADAEPVVKRLAAPTGSTSLVRTIAAGPTHLAGVWATDRGQRVVLYDLTTATTGRTLVSTGAPGSPGVDLTDGEVIRQEGGDHLTLGAMFIDYSRTPAVVDLGAAFTPKTLTSGHVYGQIADGATDVRITGRDTAFKTTPGSDTAPVTPSAPIATTDTTAYVAAPKVEQFLLYAVPSLTGGKP